MKKSMLVLGIVSTMLYSTVPICATTLTSTIPVATTTATTTVSEEIPMETSRVEEIPSDLLKDDSSRPPYAFKYDEYGVSTYNYDVSKIQRKIEAKLTQGTEISATIVEYAAIIAGVVSLALIIIGSIFNKRLAGAGAISLLIDFLVYAVVGDFSILFEIFKSWLWN